MLGSSFHSSYFSIFKEDRQQTAVLSLPSLSIPVGRVISLHKLEVFILILILILIVIVIVIVIIIIIDNSNSNSNSN